MKKKIICWRSGGVTSAVAIYLTIQLFGKENIRIIFIDTFNEHVDTYRFKDDCEKWYGIEIRTGNPEWGAEPGKLYFVIKHGIVI